MIGPFVALALVVGVFTVADNLQADGGRFATLRNAQNVLVQSATVAMAALGMTMIIISAGIDLSAGTAMALSRHGAGLGLRNRAEGGIPAERTAWPWARASAPAAWPAWPTAC